jgi:hypothetical protein
MAIETPIESGDREPSNIVDQFIKLRSRDEGNFSDLNFINHAYMSGEFFRDPKALTQIQQAAGFQEIWGKMISLIETQGTPENMPRFLRTALLLGMADDPKGAEELRPDIEKYGIQNYQPTREDLVKAVQARFGSAVKAEHLEGKLANYLQNSIFSSLPENHESHTFISGEERRLILGDVLENWDQSQVSLATPDKKAIARLKKQLTGDYFKGKVSKQDADTLSKQVWALFENPALKAKYPKIAEYLAHVGQKSYDLNWTVNGEMLAFLYSIKLVQDEAQIANPNTNSKPETSEIFNKPLDFIPHRPPDIVRGRPKTETKNFGRKFATYALVGTMALGGAYTVGHFGVVSYFNGILNTTNEIVKKAGFAKSERTPISMEEYLKVLDKLKPKSTPTPMVEALQDPVVIEPEMALSFIPEPFEETADESAEQNELINQIETPPPGPVYEPNPGISAEEELRNALEYQRQIDEGTERYLAELRAIWEEDEDKSQSSSEESTEDKPEAEAETEPEEAA